MGAALSIHSESDFWNTDRQDRVFRRYFYILFTFALILGIILYQYQATPEALLNTPKPKPAITKILLKKEPPPPVVETPEPVQPEPEPPKPEPAPEPEPAPAPEPAPIPAPEPEVQAPPEPTQAEVRQAARAKAQNTGLAALSKDMSGLTDLADNTAQASASKVVAASSDSGQAQERLYAASAQQGQADLSGNASSADLDARLAQGQTSGATSTAGGGDAVLASGGSGSGGSGAGAAAGQRDEASVRRIFEQSKSSASALYNRALRQNPTMSGRVTFEVEIAPDGSVTAASIVSSELNDADLERKLLLKVRSLQFGAKDVAVLKLTYSYDFLPS